MTEQTKLITDEKITTTNGARSIKSDIRTACDEHLRDE